MKTTKIILSILFISFLIISCGGGDGNGGSSGGSGQVSQDSVDDFVTFITDNVSGCTSQSLSASVKAINISSMLSSSIKSYNRYTSLPAPVKSIAQAVGVPEEVPDVCDTGTLSITPTSESNTSIGGSVNFSNCSIGLDGDSASINGSLSFTLQGSDIAQGNISSLSASSNGITVNAAGESVTIAFNISSSFTISGEGDLTGLNATISSLSITDNNLSETYSLTSTTIQASGLDTDIVTISSNGTYSDPVLGSFTFSTPSGLTFDATVQGSETVTGSIQVNGGNDSEILVTINEDADIIIEGDADGDGTADFSDTLNCSDLSLDTSGLPTF